MGIALWIIRLLAATFAGAGAMKLVKPLVRGERIAWLSKLADRYLPP